MVHTQLVNTGKSRAGTFSYQQERSSLDMDGNNADADADVGPNVTSSRSRLLMHVGDERSISITNESSAANRIFFNFVVMSLLFAANHGCVVACLGLATARLGSVGAWQSGLLYLTYTGSALFGATYVVKRLGARNAIMFGMLLYCFYVGAFWLGTTVPAHARLAALTGASIGGVGAGFIWTAQGSFFAQAAEEHASASGHATSVSTTKLASVFAFFYLALEVGLRSLSTVLLKFCRMDWSAVFLIYAVITILSSLLMIFVKQPSPEVRSTGRVGVDRAPAACSDDDDDDDDDAYDTATSSSWYKATVTFQLLLRDRKMRYMIGLNAVFGLTSAFLNSYINGEVVQVVFHDKDSEIVGLLTSWVPIVAAAMSLVFGRIHWHKGHILSLGAVCFAMVVIPFVMFPDVSRHWNAAMAVAVYTFHGIGRATFEGTLKATFADFFPREKEGAFANLILQNGLASAVGFVLPFALKCRSASLRCVEYQDGSFHNVFIFELMVLATAVFAVWGYWRADKLHRQRDERDRSVWTLVES